MMSKHSVVRATIGEAIKQQVMTVLTAMCSAFLAVFTSRYHPLVVSHENTKSANGNQN